MTDNEDGLTDDDGTRQDWIELRNTTASPVNMSGWYLSDNTASRTKWPFPAVSIPAGGTLLVWASEKDRRDPTRALHTNFKLSVAGEYLGLSHLPPGEALEIVHEYEPAFPPQYEDVSYGMAQTSTSTTLLGSGTTTRYLVPASGALDVNQGLNTSNWIGTAFADTAWTAATLPLHYGRDASDPYDALPGTDIDTPLYNVRTSLYTRTAFTINSLADVGTVRLRIQSDDGYIAYLNGVPVPIADFNGPENEGATTLQWNSVAAAEFPDATSTAWQEVVVDKSLLLTGANVLCVHGFNRALTNNDFLLWPELIADSSTGTFTGSNHYFRVPTPNSLNVNGSANPGPNISGTTENPVQPTAPVPGDPPAASLLTLTSRVARTVNPLQSVVCKFRVMQSAEQSLTMHDTGTGSDALAGDGTYSCQADISLVHPGEMLRWRIIATDSGGATAIDPPFTYPLNSPQYFGTVVNDSSLSTSQLQVFHWFPVNAGNAATSTGDRGSVFHLGEFYDNVRAKLHGQSTSSFAKKSLGFDFAHDQRFRFKAGENRVRDILLLSNWADKSKVRHTLAWESYRVGGVPALVAFPVRVQQNGLPYGVFDMVEDADDLYLDRAGLDPNGALYKMYNQFNSTPGHANSGVEKKSRQWETNQDLLGLLNGLNPAGGVAASLNARRQFAYDNVDLFTLANNLAITALTTNNDQGHKNYFLYRDSDGTREWKLLPWDCDLSFGHTWTSNTFSANPPQIGAAYFDDSIDSQRGLQLGLTNWLKQIAYNCPEFNRMYLRRLRTLMDQWFISETSTTGYFETRMTEVLDQIDPPALAPTQTDAWLDGQRWGTWWVTLPWKNTNVNTSATVAGTAANFAQVWALHGPRASLARIINPNGNPTSVTLATAANGIAHSAYISTANYPGGSITNTAAAPGPYTLTYAANTYPPFAGATTIHPYLKGRRLRLYDTTASRLTSDRDQSGTTTNDRDIIPAAQTAAPNVVIAPDAGLIDVNPGAQTQEAEFFVIRNQETTGVDISGWSITGAISYTFPGGCVIPPAEPTSTLPNAANLGLLHVAKNPFKFRTRTSGPTGGQSRLVTGPYRGQLSARGETIELRNAAGLVVNSFTYGQNPTPAQAALRIAELLYNPAAPVPTELASDPALQRNSFEWIELVNTGDAALTLTGAQFIEGISFTFPASTLSPGERIVVAANPAAFALRNPGVAVPVLGPWTGSLDDGGEQLHLVDASGESVLEFAYDGAWYWPSDNAGHSLVVLDTAGAAYSDYDLETVWGLSTSPGGTPGTEHSAVGTIYKQWRRAVATGFTPAEQLDNLTSGPDANPDGDTSNNVLEYATGTPPNSPGGDPGTTLGIVSETGESYATLTFRRRKNAPDLQCIPEASHDLNAWMEMPTPTGPVTDNGDGTETVTFRDSDPVGGRRLLRLRVVVTTP